METQQIGDPITGEAVANTPPAEADPRPALVAVEVAKVIGGKEFSSEELKRTAAQAQKAVKFFGMANTVGL